MLFVYLVRHGEYQSDVRHMPGRLPVPLSENGESQAECLRDYFAEKNIHYIYSSAVERCKQTSEIIADGKISIIYDKRILETFSAYQGYWGENWHGNGYHFFSHCDELGGESLEDVQYRMVEFWNELRSDLKGNVIVCSHSDPIITLKCYIEKRPLPTNDKERNKNVRLSLGEVLPLRVESEEVILESVVNQSMMKSR